jgi:hypothetical protein
VLGSGSVAAPGELAPIALAGCLGLLKTLATAILNAASSNNVLKACDALMFGGACACRPPAIVLLAVVP